MNLEQLADGTKTDKNYYHSYLPLYQTLMEHKQLTAKHVLEIGIERGGSIKLWHDFFPHATIEAIDVRPMSDMWEGILNNDRIVLHTSTDAYDFSFFHSLYNQGIKYDVLIDDGPHTLTSMITFLQLYSHLMTDDGILIIEDVQSIDWIPALADSVPEKFKPFINSCNTSRLICGSISSIQKRKPVRFITNKKIVVIKIYLMLIATIFLRYQLDFVTPGSKQLCAISLKTWRETPKLL